MKIIDQSYKILSITDPKLIELAGRTAYKSEDKINDDSYKEFISMIAKRNHQAVLEHSMMSILFITDRGISHELVRHRIASFTQESTRYCVAGNTILNTKNPHKKFTIEQLFMNKLNSKNGSWKRLKIKQLNENDGEIICSKIKNIFYNGLKRTIKITTALGYNITCTKDHLIYTPNGYVNAGYLTKGSSIYVNGQNIHSNFLYRNFDWLYNQNITLNKTFIQIAKEFGYNVSTLKKWGIKLNIPKKGTGYFNKNRIPWNKGLKETDDIRVKNQGEALRNYHYDQSKKGIKILKEDTSAYQKHKNHFCSICKSNGELEVHHKDENRNNNKINNLITVCESCHQRIHSKNLLILAEDTIINIENIGYEKVFDIEMNSKYSNYSANGIIVHNCNYSKDKFDNGITFIKPDWYNSLNNADEDDISYHWYHCMKQCEQTYLLLLEKGLSPQFARAVLPNSLKTEIVITTNFREWRHIFQLRAIEKSAHPQMRQLMIPLYKECKNILPEVFNLGEPE